MNKIKKKIQELATKAVGAYSLIQLDAKEKRDKKREKQKQLEELRGSFYCPKCGIRYSSTQYYSSKTKKEDIKIDEQHGSVYFNFLECMQCRELFGVKETHYHGGFDLSASRSSFSLRDKTKI